MTSGTSPVGSDSLRVVLEQMGLVRVAIVDDAFDAIELRLEEARDLWTTLEFSEEARAEIDQFGLTISSPDDLTGEVVDELLRSRSQCPTFGALWDRSMGGQRIAEGLNPLNRLVEQLQGPLGLDVRKFGASATTAQLIADETQLLFLDWYLGEDPQTAVETAVTKVKDILSMWPDEWQKPLIVLMSSHTGLRESAGEFCRKSELLRGMFYAVPKSELTDRFNLRMHMRLFAMSLPAGRRLQKFVDALRKGIEDKKGEFIADISDLTLNDYAYIQSLSLQDDGQPLGDYLLWLFSSYFGQMLFADALGAQRDELDRMTFTETLPSLGPPSERLTELYHCALFDTSVGSVNSHPRAEGGPAAPVEANEPSLALGDVLRRQLPPGDDTKGLEQAPAGTRPDLYLVINAQCDLEFTPDRDSRPADLERAVLLLPGRLQSVLEPVAHDSKPKTELYLHNGGSYRIMWDTRQILTVPYGQFPTWAEKEGWERVGRLRLPFALEVQRAFAADLTRVGTPVMPPIYQPVVAQVLRVNQENKVFEATNELRGDEAAFLVLTRDGQQCVLTLPLVVRLKTLLDERLRIMGDSLEAGGGSDAKHLTLQLGALERAIANDDKWASLLSPFKLTGSDKSVKFLDDRIQVVWNKKKGDTSDSTTIAVVSLDLGDLTR